MRIFFNKTGKSYESDLNRIYQDSGNEIIWFDSSNLKDASAEFESTDARSCFVVSINDLNCVKEALVLLRRNIENKTIVLISNFLTWGGKKYAEPIADIESNFFVRTPLISHFDKFQIENAFYNLCKSTGRGCIVGVGLVYGGCGHDFEPVFRSLWENDISSGGVTKVISTQSGRNHIPMIHIHDLASQLNYLMETCDFFSDPAACRYFPLHDSAFGTPSPNTSTSLLSSKVVPPGKINWSVDMIMKCMSDVLLSRPFKYTTSEECLELYADDSASVWLLDISFYSLPFQENILSPSASKDKFFGKPVSSSRVLAMSHICFPEKGYTAGLSGPNFMKIWKEFISFHKLQPCVIVVVGGPKTGKTSVANGIAKLMKMRVLSTYMCVRETLAASDGQILSPRPGTPAVGSSTAPPVEGSLARSIAVHLRSKIVVFIENQLKIAAENDPKNKAKKGVAEIQIPTVDYMNLPEDQLKSIPTSMMRQCISWVLYNGIMTGSYHGAVLDLYELGVQTRDELTEIFACQQLAPPRALTGASRRLTNLTSGGNANSTTELSQPPSQSISRQMSGNDSTPMNRSSAVTPVHAARRETGASLVDDNIVVQNAMVWPDVIIEVQCDRAAITRKLMLQLGSSFDVPIAKLPKDHQTQITALEGILSAYAEKLVLIDDKEPSSYRNVSHSSVVAIEQTESHPDGFGLSVVEKWRPKVLRFDMTPVFTSNATNVAFTEEELVGAIDQVLESYVSTVHGVIGWLPQYPKAVVSPESTPTTDLNTVESTEQNSTGCVSALTSCECSTELDMVGVNNVIESIDLESDRVQLSSTLSIIDKYLLANVLPHVSEGMIRVAREKPEDPVKFMHQFLLERGNELQMKAKNAAFDNFVSALPIEEAKEFLARQVAVNN